MNACHAELATVGDFHCLSISKARHGKQTAKHGKTRHGRAWQGLARQSLAWPSRAGKARLDLVGLDQVVSDMVKHGIAGMKRLSAAKRDMAEPSKVWHGAAWWGLARQVAQGGAWTRWDRLSMAL